MAGTPQAAAIPLDVVDAARSGDADAIGHIYRLLAPAVIGYLRGSGAADPENLAGDVFVGVVRGLPRFSGDGAALRTWVFTIAHRRLVDERRRARRRPDLGPLDAHAPWAGVADDVERVLDAMCARPVRDAFAALTPDQRTVVLLRVVAELSVEQTAQAMRKPVAAVKMLQRRALRAMAKKIPQHAVT
jgi:RNA polymerase sigma-70 factor (ECF subfamily)